MPRIAFSWNGLPQYAARLLRGALESLDENCAVIGSKPSVPVEGMEKALQHPVHWVDADKPVSWRELGLEVPRLYFQSGWAYPAFTALGAEVKGQGGRVIGMSDANWRGDFRQLVLGAAAFRLNYRRHFDAMLVPGEEGRRLMRWFGLPDSRIRCGMYGADPAIFGGGPPLADRPKTFLYVGQFIARKDVLGLSAAFLQFAESHPDWRLHLIGGGAQRDLIPRHPRILVEEFVQPEELAQRFHAARFFVLPSLMEAWGLVVHEAALCGCALLLSGRIGSAGDLCTGVNGLRFRAGDPGELARTLAAAAACDATWLAAAETESRRLAARFGPERFASEAVRLVSDFSNGALRRTAMNGGEG
jgi:glycosyltransferase involved in cell wall biosynthesis